MVLQLGVGHRKVKLKFIQSNGCRVCILQYLKDEVVLPPEEQQVCFSARLKVISNTQLQGKAVLGSLLVQAAN